MAWNTPTHHYYSGQGVLLAALRDLDGNPLGFRHLGNVTDLKVSVSTATQEHKESQSGQRAVDLILTTETKCGLSLSMEDFSSDNLSLALRGVDTLIAADTAATSTKKFYPGAITALEHVKVSGVSIATVGGTPVTLTPYTTATANWDYKVNLEAGSIQINPNPAKYGNLTTTLMTNSGLSCTVTYDHASQVKVDALTTGPTELYLRFEGLNTADNNAPVVVEVFRFQTNPLKELALLSDSVQNFVLDGTALSDPTKDEGSRFFRVLKLA